MKKLIIFCTLLCALILALAGCTAPEADVDGAPLAPDEVIEETDGGETEADVPAIKDIFEDSGITKFELKSEDLLEDGSWKDVIGKDGKGINASPQLSWEAVEGAQSYVILMTDVDAWDWVHWKQNDVKQTNVPQGFAEANDEYVGPYPPAGSTHNYVVYVVALKQPVERVKGGLNAANPKFAANVLSLDEVNGESGNILGYGIISGTYSN